MESDLRAVLFDLDGTLLDSVPIILRAAQRVFDAMDLPYDEPALRKMIGIPLRIQAQRVAGERAEEFVVRYRRVYTRYQDKDAHLFPHTTEMLDAIRSGGYLTGIVTSKAAPSAHRALARTGLASFFNTIVTADDVKHPKPDPEPIIKAMYALHVEPENTLYVGDSLYDIDMAQRANVPAAGMSWGARSREDLLLVCPESVFDSWQDFLVWLNLPMHSI